MNCHMSSETDIMKQGHCMQFLYAQFMEFIKSITAIENEAIAQTCFII